MMTPTDGHDGLLINVGAEVLSGHQVGQAGNADQRELNDLDLADIGQQGNAAGDVGHAADGQSDGQDDPGVAQSAGSADQEGHDHDDQSAALPADDVHDRLGNAVGAAGGGQRTANGCAGQRGKQIGSDNADAAGQEGGKQCVGVGGGNAEGEDDDRQNGRVNTGHLGEAQGDEDDQADREDDHRASGSSQKCHKLSLLK